MRRDGTLLFSPRQVFGSLGIGCLVGAALMMVVRRDALVATLAALSFVAAAAICVVLATAWGSADRERTLHRIVAVAVLGATAALPGWYFGPSSAYAGVVAVLLVSTGLLMGGTGTAFPTAAAWAVYATLAGGQAVIAILVFSGVLRDASLLPVVPDGARAWHHVAAHVTVQITYAAAFAIGRVLHRRYWALSEALDLAHRAAARRNALLDEARAEYRRKLALGRSGMFAGHTIDRYRLGELIGRGGDGEVYEARDVVEGTTVALKVLRGDRVADPAGVRRLLDEASALSRIESPFVVRALRTGVVDDALPFIAMERLEGSSLANQLARSGRLDVPRTRQLVDDIARALEAAHTAGVCHGDINPNNLMLVAGSWKLIDFGAGRADPEGEQVVGTRRFIAPERIVGTAPSPAADLYGLCAAVYTALTGREPHADVPAAALPSVAAARMPLDPRLLADIPAAAADALAIGLAPDPSQRYDDARALRVALLAALDGVHDDAIEQRAAALAWCVAPAVEQDATSTSPAAAPPPPVQSPPPFGIPASGPRALVEAMPPQVVSDAWGGAFADKMRMQYASVLAACVLGTVLISLIVDDIAMRLFALVTIGVTACLIAYARARDAEWPWIAVGTLAIVPTYVLGLHSGVAAVIAVTLFVESSFRSFDGAITGRGWILLAVLLGHLAAFAAITTGVIPDSTVTPVTHHTPRWTGVVLELAVCSIYVTASALGHIVYRRHVDLVHRNEQAAREAASQEALLATARTEIDRVLAGEAGGLFTGTRIGGYDVENLLGRGGMGEVYAARGPSQRVALKVIRADRVTDPASIARFVREGEALRRIDSPNVARVLEVGTADGRLPYLAMELVEGRSLADLLHATDPMALVDVRRLVQDVARGLADVHAAGVVHRDVKPHNLVLTTVDGLPRWKLVDFGVATFPGAASATTDDAIVGTPAYMAPEQMTGGVVDPRADLYSFCLVLYRVLAGQPAFTRTRVLQPTMAAPDPRRSRHIPAPLAEVLHVGLAATTGERFSSAGELEAAMLAAIDDALAAGASTNHALDAATEAPNETAPR